ncbi:MAG TPA: hypothetical protein VKE98_15780 [Gemmataceae bacterium]|nr:hypothetical protein [Gemmataceae bacterium]
MMLRARIAAAGVLFVLLVSVGCNKSNPNTPASVFGKVTYNGNTVGGGFVYLHLNDGGRLPCAIGADGSYSAETKEGVYVLTVETESLNPNKKEEYRGGSGGGGLAAKYGKAGGGPPAMAKGKGAGASPAPEGAGGAATTYVKIPPKYADKATSGLSVTLKPGKTQFDIPLTD